MRIIDIKAIIISINRALKIIHTKMLSTFLRAINPQKNIESVETQWEYKFDSRITSDLIRSVSNPICYIK